jgi:glycerol-3-phosphate O-acyltransferase / dihydroxyacetone phosphate acyltransferase
VRRAIRLLCRLALRVFFRRVEVQGAERVPAEGPVVLVANHPSALVDPMVLLAFLARPACFLSKEPLFRTPVIGAFLRALDAIPVYRAMDGADPRRNQRTFVRAGQVLRRGGVLALFPEGTSHDDPRMKPLKSGAARIALGTASAGEGLPLTIVPAGLFFTDKGTFRSEALLSLGEPLPVVPTALGDGGEPVPAEVRALTQRIDAALSAVVLQAEKQEALALAAAAERLFDGGEAAALAERVALRRRLLEGRRRLAALDPAGLAALERRMAEHLARADVLDRPPPRARELWTAALAVVLAPAALAGAVAHAPAWMVVDRIARRVAGADRSMDATVKILAGLVFYPLTWAGAGLAVGLWRGGLAGAAVALGLLACGAAALAFSEATAPLIGLVRHAVLRLARGPALRRLEADRDALRAEILAAAERVEPNSARDRTWS